MAMINLFGQERYVNDSAIQYFKFHFPDKYKGKWAVHDLITETYDYIGKDYKFCKQKADELNASMTMEFRTWAYKRMLEHGMYD